MELRTGSSVSNVHCELEYGHDSETGSESVVTRIGVPLAGPVAMPLNGGEHLYRYSADFPEPIFPPKVCKLVSGFTINWIDGYFLHCFRLLKATRTQHFFPNKILKIYQQFCFEYEREP